MIFHALHRSSEFAAGYIEECVAALPTEQVAWSEKSCLFI